MWRGRRRRQREALQWPVDWALRATGSNGGLRRMSDLETPEADRMRDQSSLDAAPATLRPEESSRVSIPITPAWPLTQPYSAGVGAEKQISEGRAQQVRDAAPGKVMRSVVNEV